ncbi:MAG: hypothetical protein AB2541_00525 [Candidatus Thiodiazotropha sp.]
MLERLWDNVMACGKPPEPGRATPPSDRCDFAIRQAQDVLEHIERMVAVGDLGDKLDARMESADQVIERLKATGAPDTQIRKLEGRLGRIRGNAMGVIRKEAEGLNRSKHSDDNSPSGEQVLKKLRDGASERSAERARDVLTKPGHWAHEAFKKEVFRVIEANGKIPEDYKESLARDTAMLLRVCPSAGGLVAAMVTRGQPRGTFARRMNTKGNDAVGAAYEIMGTAALCDRVSAPANTRHNAPNLSIDPTKDKLTFGNKAYMNHRYAYDRKIANRDRRTVEADAQLFQKGREIAIDYKHVKEGGTRSNSTELKNQLKAVAEAISHGHFDEYHFVTNGKFSESFKATVEAVNDDLVAKGNVPITCHEYVNSIGDDPHADGEA